MQKCKFPDIFIRRIFGKGVLFGCRKLKQFEKKHEDLAAQKAEHTVQLTVTESRSQVLVRTNFGQDFRYFWHNRYARRLQGRSHRPLPAVCPCLL